MGRWGHKLYQSDQALDAYAQIIDQLYKQMAYWTQPEQVTRDSQWLDILLSIVEAMILNTEYLFDTSADLMERNNAVQRWRRLVLEVWDANWKGREFHPPPLDDSDYRHLHRQRVIDLFDYLEAVAHYWELLGSLTFEERKDLENPTLPVNYPLPFFSIYRRTVDSGKVFFNTSRVVSELIEFIARNIIYWLSEEREDQVFIYLEDIWVSADILRLFCSRYKQSPGVSDQHVRAWRDKCWQIREDEGYHLTSPEKDEALSREVNEIFHQLELLTQQYPPLY